MSIRSSRRYDRLFEQVREMRDASAVGVDGALAALKAGDQLDDGVAVLAVRTTPVSKESTDIHDCLFWLNMSPYLAIHAILSCLNAVVQENPAFRETVDLAVVYKVPEELQPYAEQDEFIIRMGDSAPDELRAAADKAVNAILTQRNEVALIDMLKELNTHVRPATAASPRKQGSRRGRQEPKPRKPAKRA